jgi:integrating conjugative element membrane protein (TIGR03745 family)
MLSAPLAHAALPTPVPPSGGAGSGDWFGLIRGYLQDGAIILGLAISVIAFLWASYAALAKFNEARQGRAEWSEVGLLGVVAAGVLLFTGFLLNEAAIVF